MVKSLALLVGAAAGETVKLSYTDCGSSGTHAKITSLKPETIDVPGQASIVGSGALDSDQTSASFSLKVKKAGIPLVSGKGSICEDTTIKVPLGAGSFTVKGIDCPIKTGNVDVQVDLDILSELADDGENNLLSIHIEANADDTGDQVICLDVDASLASHANSAWEEYKQQFGKVYNGDESERKAIFMENQKMFGAHESGAILGPTVFSDLTLEEFQALNIRGYKASADLGLPKLGEHTLEAFDGAVDWTTKGAVTPVKDQGQCGSCWAFSTTGGLEGSWQIASGSLTSMSEQFFVDCSKQNSGCNGGLMDYAFSFAKSNAVPTEDSYPYTARDGTCQSSGTTAIPAGGVTGYTDVSDSASALKSALDGQPVSVAIQADQSVFQHYTGGVITSGCGSNLDHGVTAVGYDGDTIKVKNSWGSSWGMSGYVSIDASQCGITTSASFPKVSAGVQV